MTHIPGVCMSLTTHARYSLLTDGCCTTDRLTAIRELSHAAFAPLPQALVRPVSSSWIPHPRSGSSTKADTIVYGAISPGLPGSDQAEAMAIRSGIIVGIGSVSDVEGFRDPQTEIVDAGDGVVIPGLIEPHMHLWSTMLADSWENCSALENATFEEVIARLKSVAARTGAGEWIQGQLFDPSLYPGEPELTRDILDQVSTQHPIGVLNASMHYLYVNS
jgi:predicted amidohydrolase YtcJ